MRVPRLYKVLFFGFLAYAVATARPETQGQIIGGGLAIKDAAIEACQREDSLCSNAIAWMGSTVSRSLNDNDARWLDEPHKRASGERVWVKPDPAAPSAPSGS
jgi:hypothetical protein